MKSIRPPRHKTFLFSDVEGSTKLWESEPVEMAAALRTHDRLVREAIEGSGGVIFKSVGDGFYATFDEPTASVLAALVAQKVLLAEQWPTSRPIRVRMAMHSGDPEARDGDYFGPVLNRLARLLAAGHGGQVLLTRATVDEVSEALPEGCGLIDLGTHRLSDLERPEQVSMLVHSDLRSEFPALRTLNSYPNNLPRHLSTFVGRQSELEQLGKMLDDGILITVTGSGGTGKSRLALQSAAENLERFPDGVWFIELAALTEGGLISQTVASALGVRETAGISLAQALSDHLRAKTALIVLDNCEHLVESAAQFVEKALQAAPRLQILATSREALGLPGEAIFRIPSLPVPDLLHSQTAQQALQSDAVRLLVARARSVQPNFQLGDDAAEFAVKICQRLDGIPFAIELAASRLRALTLRQIAERLDDRFGLLTSGSRTALPRQQTLRAMMDWSYDLLDGPEKVLLTRLAVFAGSCTLEAAEEVCSDDQHDRYEVLESIARLVDKSLLTHDDTIDPPRYRMLETVREYASEKLAASGEEDRVRERHARAFSKFCGEVEEKLTGPDQIHWLDILESEHDNIRAAIAFCRDHPEHLEVGLSLVGAIGRFWTVRGFLSEGRAWIDSLLEVAGSDATEAVATACRTAGQLAYWQGDAKAGRRYGEMSLKTCRAIGDRRGETISLFRIGFAALADGDLVAARSHFEQARDLGTELDDQAGMPHLINALGEVGLAEGKLTEAKERFEEALRLFEGQGDRRSIASVMKSLGMIACEEGRLDTSLDYLKKGLQIRVDLQNTPGIAATLDCLGVVAAHRGQYEKSVVLLAAAHALHDRHGSRPEPSDSARTDEARAKADAALGFADFDRCWKVGLSLPLDAALTFASSDAKDVLSAMKM